MQAADEKVYTYKSRQLANVMLSGMNNANLAGNAGDKTLEGRQGNDVLDGGRGTYTAVFAGFSCDYVISMRSDVVIVEDGRQGRDGRDTLKNIELLRFTDKPVSDQSLHAQSSRSSL